MAIPVRRDVLSAPFAPLSFSAFFFYLDVSRVLVLIGRCVYRLQPYLFFSSLLLLRGFIPFLPPIFSLLLNF